jgi:hypothetical protein
MKQKWNDTKEQIVNALKFTILTTTMIMGFWVTYAIIWFAVGLPETNWAMWILFALSIASECCYVKWIAN